ncbi:hypothetical protein F4782DRAFT_486362 [Xylaria castorea]|nr:hypothetical protein F4782DRAFT_486362 [Xylaria castorea]
MCICFGVSTLGSVLCKGSVSWGCGIPSIKQFDVVYPQIDNMPIFKATWGHQSFQTLTMGHFRLGINMRHLSNCQECSHCSHCSHLGFVLGLCTVGRRRGKGQFNETASRMIANPRVSIIRPSADRPRPSSACAFNLHHSFLGVAKE